MCAQILLRLSTYPGHRLKRCFETPRRLYRVRLYPHPRSKLITIFPLIVIIDVVVMNFIIDFIQLSKIARIVHNRMQGDSYPRKQGF